MGTASQSPPPTAATPPPAPPAAQVAQAAASIVIDNRGAGAVSVHLQPAELGAVSIHVTRPLDNTPIVTVTVERVATLHALQSDIGHLHAALDRAGVPDSRSINIHLVASADPGGDPSGSRGDTGGNQGFLGLTNGGSSSGGAGLGGQWNQGNSHSQPSRGSAATLETQSQDLPALRQSGRAARSGNASIDITA